LTVFAAASLREAFEEVARLFEAATPGAKVRLNLAGSQELRAQIEQGARADVFASADVKHAAALAGAGLVDDPTVFARNEPVVVVPRDNPAGVRTFGDLPNARRIVVGAPEVPIGAYTLQILGRAQGPLGADFEARVLGRVVSRELNVRQVLAKVTLGEADAGIVYRTDARTAKEKVAEIPIPPAINVAAEYPVAIVKSTKQPLLAAAFVALLLAPRGQARLATAGFLRRGDPSPR
jgi:molybdate transport system substrate-binding protein